MSKTTALLVTLLFSVPINAQISQPKVREAAGIRISHEARSLQPGEVVVLRIVSPNPLRDLKASAFERTFLLYPSDEGRTWDGLVGIDLDVKPGRYQVLLAGTDGDGSRISLDHTLEIEGKNFPTRHLSVDEKFVNPPPDVTDRIRKESKTVQEIFSSVTPEKLWTAAFQRPVSGPVISSFGKRSVLNGQPRSPHSGTDFRGSTGTPIKAPNAGTVVLAGDLYYSGNTVIIDHGYGLYSYLAHMSRIAVNQGDHVKAGQVVGEVGATGRVTGPHLHWTVRLAGARVDPLSLIAASKTDVAR